MALPSGYENGTLVRDFIPCKNASGTVGMWDDANSEFYANAGTGSFSGSNAAGDHNTNSGSVSYEIESGTVNIGGVVREIESGLVLVGGVAREIEFGEPNLKVSITGDGGSYASVTIAGTVYNSQTTVEVPAGTEITLTAKGSGTIALVGQILVDGTRVASSASTVTYPFVVNSDISVALTIVTSKANAGRVEVTTS